jgi:hypothetical protein
MTALLIQAVNGALVASDAATATATLSNAIVAGDVVVALIATAAANTNHNVSGLGATWTRVGRDTLALLDLWIGTGATATGTVTATQTTSVGGATKFVSLWHLRGTTTAYVGGVDNATGDTLVGTAMDVAPGQIFIGAGYSDTVANSFTSPSPAAGGWTTSTVEFVGSSRWATRAHRIPPVEESHQFGTYRAGSTAHPLVRLVVGTVDETPPEAAAPVVEGCYTGAVTTAANPTVNFAGTPDPGDILILVLADGGLSGAMPTAVSGCGAAWSRLPGGINYIYSVWIGVGATTSGTITVTAASYSNGRALRVYHLSGADPNEIYIQRMDDTYRVRVTANQLVLGLGYSTTTSTSALATKRPALGWVEQAQLTYPGTNNYFNSAHLVPRFVADVYVQGTGDALMMVFGSPVPGEVITRRNWCHNSTFGAATGWAVTNASSSGVSTEQAYIGTTSYKLTALNTGSTTTLARGTSEPQVAVVAGQQWTVSTYIRSVNARNGRAIIRWRSSNGASLVSTSNGTTTPLPGGVWTRVSITATAPAGAYYMCPGAEITDTVAADVYYFDAVLAEDGVAVGDYFHGGHTTPDRLNAYSGPDSLYSSVQTTIPPATAPQIVNTYDRAPESTINQTMEMPVAPAVGDTLLLVTVTEHTTIPRVSAVSGLGATWKRIGVANNYMTLWLGTGATFSGTITMTGSGNAGIRAARLMQLRGVDSDVYFQQYHINYPLQATDNQLVIGACFSQSSTDPLVASVSPSLGWTEGAAVTLSASRRFTTVHQTPQYPTTFNAAPDDYGAMMVFGSPVQGWAISRRNGCGNPTFESTTTDWLRTGLTSLNISTTQQVQGLASATANYNGANGIIEKGTGGNGPPLHVAEGDTITVSAWVRCNNTRSAGIYPQWLGQSQTLISNGAYSDAPLPANTWTRMSWTGVVPASIFAVSPAFRVSNILTGDTVWYDGFLLEVDDTMGDYFDGFSTDTAELRHAFVGHNELAQSVQMIPIPEAPEVPAPDPITLRRRESGVWVVHTGVAKARIGGEWVPVQGKSWNGTAWVDLS